jgi:hypothetical protein
MKTTNIKSYFRLFLFFSLIGGIGILYFSAIYLIPL